MIRRLSLLVILITTLIKLNSQDTIILDKIIVRIGDEIILKSELEENYMQAMLMSVSNKPDKCSILEQLMIQKLLINQSKIDSIFVTEDEIESELNMRLNLFVNQAGSIAALESYYNKPYFEIKEDMKKVMREQFLSEKEKNHIIGEISITPSEVADFFKKIPAENLPLIEESYEIRVMYVYPKMSKEEEQEIINQLEDLKAKILNGQRRFDAMARMYSKDESSAKNGGELGFMMRGELDPDFASVAFSLKPDEISNVVKTRFGYHLIQMIERKGQRVNVRHILVRPTFSSATQQSAIKLTDSIRNLIVENKISFSDAAKQYSEDKTTKNNGGLLYNQKEEKSTFTISELNAQTRYEISGLNQGDISEPIISTDQYQITVIKLYKVEKKIPAHIANIKEDYPAIYKLALANKKEQEFDKWLKKTIGKTYIFVDNAYKGCEFKYNWK